LSGSPGQPGDDGGSSIGPREPAEIEHVVHADARDVLAAPRHSVAISR
jgi:hypothetical protein